MNENNAQNVSTGKPKAAGAVWTAPVGTTLPSDGVEPLEAAFTNMGYVSDEGVKNNTDISTQDINAWGGDVVLSTQTSYKETFALTFIETNVPVLKEYYGADNVIETATAIEVRHGAVDAPGHPWVIETVMQDGRVQRVVIPNGKLGERGEITYNDGDAIGYQMTINALPDASGCSAYTHFAKVAA